MKTLIYQLQSGKWESHYRRPDDHPDIKDWERECAKPRSRYKIVDTSEEDKYLFGMKGEWYATYTGSGMVSHFFKEGESLSLCGVGNQAGLRHRHLCKKCLAKMKKLGENNE